MTVPVMLSIRGRQSYQEQEPEQIELVTEGLLGQEDGSWIISYEESELTGLPGVTTTFQIKDDVITLSRKGPLTSQMVFREGEFHESLYEMEFGALMLTVCAARVAHSITWQGGTIDLIYAIEIENSAAGVIEYHLDIRAK